jgi:molybdenum cofactor cytidylyltransferase
MPGAHFSPRADVRSGSASPDIGAPAARGVVVVVLGAGFGRRFGGDKLSAVLPDGRAVGAASLAVARAAWPDVVCVARPDTGMARIARESGVPLIECPDAVGGMGHSLAAAVRATAGAAGWVIALGDMPFMAPATLRAVAESVAAGQLIVAPSFGGERGHPVGFGAALGPELAALAGDEGARTVLARHRDRLTLLSVSDAGVLRDVDQPTDLAGTVVDPRPD